MNMHPNDCLLELYSGFNIVCHSKMKVKSTNLITNSCDVYTVVIKNTNCYTPNIAMLSR